MNWLHLKSGSDVRGVAMGDQPVLTTHIAKCLGMAFARFTAAKTKKPVTQEDPDPFMEDVRNRLQRKYGTKVEIKNKCIMIRYNDVDDLNRILEIMNVIED